MVPYDINIVNIYNRLSPFSSHNITIRCIQLMPHLFWFPDEDDQTISLILPHCDAHTVHISTDFTEARQSLAGASKPEEKLSGYVPPSDQNRPPPSPQVIYRSGQVQGDIT